MPAVWMLLSCHPALPVASPGLEPTGRPAASPGAPIAATAVELASFTVAAVGDTMPHSPVLRSARDADVVVGEASTNHGGFDALFEGVRGPLSSADLAFTNLETPVAPVHVKGTREMVFNAPPVLLDGLVAAGIDVVSVANNHSWDQGRDGYEETLDQVGSRTLVPVGGGKTCAEARAARLLDRNGIRVGWIGATDLYNNDLNRGEDGVCVFTLDLERVRASAASAREQGAELVVLSVHWGIEYETAPEPRHVELAHQLIDAGVDVILGHHPHVLQPIEVVEASDGRTGVVVYSLGNFLSNQSAWYVPGVHDLEDGDTRDGLLVTFRVVRKQYGRGSGAVVRTEVADLVATPLWTTNNTWRRGRDEPVLVRMGPTEARARALEAELAAATDPKDVVRLSRELEEMRVRWRRVSEVVGPGWLPRGFLPPATPDGEEG